MLAEQQRTGAAPFKFIAADAVAAKEAASEASQQEARARKTEAELNATTVAPIPQPNGNKPVIIHQSRHAARIASATKATAAASEALDEAAKQLDAMQLTVVASCIPEVKRNAALYEAALMEAGGDAARCKLQGALDKVTNTSPLKKGDKVEVAENRHFIKGLVQSQDGDLVTVVRTSAPFPSLFVPIRLSLGFARSLARARTHACARTPVHMHGSSI
jgi:hypothetical protein